MMDPKLQNTILELRMTSKRLNTESAKSRKRQDAEKAKIKKAIQQGNAEGAKVYAQNAIREKNMSMMYLRLASRMDGIQSRLQMASAMSSVMKDIDKVTSQLQRASKSMNIQEINKILDKFDQQVTHMDTVSDVVSAAMDDNMSGQVASDEVANLISQVADENQLNLDGEFSNLMPTRTDLAPQQVQAQPAAHDNVDERLRRLLESD
ncbi:putative Charged multivesicular body protein 1 [Blattamonas nauphoetae]|uniref:Charged multivesicular body protein 1 n=1 Tax=Blattamonas nauphoetae TaxID=2049346 RepID=A0ABQ9YKP4_9EUKA|nr:putative Charged multivesicular body protein 1 [Blattamonas nauphoetae]